jgi:hypothetical protein
VQALVGAARLRGSLGPLRVAIEGARRSVTDSVLSYAGAKDPATGEYWGGVVAQGGRLELALVGGTGRIYGYGGYDQLVGFHVAENWRATAGTGAEARLPVGAWGELTAGLDAIGLRYDKNLRFFTFGHGGYFSPQQFVRGTAPIAWRREDGRVRWEFVAAPGYEWFREEPVSAFPVAPAAGGVDLSETYPGQTKAGFTLDARGALGWAFARGFEVRIAGGVQQAPEFEEVRGGLVLRFGGPLGTAIGGW